MNAYTDFDIIQTYWLFGIDGQTLHKCGQVKNYYGSTFDGKILLSRNKLLGILDADPGPGLCASILIPRTHFKELVQEVRPLCYNFQKPIIFVYDLSSGG